MSSAEHHLEIHFKHHILIFQMRALMLRAPVFVSGNCDSIRAELDIFNISIVTTLSILGGLGSHHLCHNGVAAAAAAEKDSGHGG